MPYGSREVFLHILTLIMKGTCHPPSPISSPVASSCLQQNSQPLDPHPAFSIHQTKIPSLRSLEPKRCDHPWILPPMPLPVHPQMSLATLLSRHVQILVLCPLTSQGQAPSPLPRGWRTCNPPCHMPPSCLWELSISLTIESSEQGAWSLLCLLGCAQPHQCEHRVSQEPSRTGSEPAF